ncbi:hypothetical protein [Ammoniphilus sp. YIM 78166]|uniref:hypothetical protein n=1 Tax=Ammoniphilus sp. YIM 78166 TaxID=1644106 RepID=UPI0010701DCD|nr:hypothetical protein [Ammoniphilus sp. YIM 78166]
MYLYQVIHLKKEIAHRKEKIYHLKILHGESDCNVIRLTGEVNQLNQEYQAILSQFPAHERLTIWNK